jgi:uncharacterized protein YbcI
MTTERPTKGQLERSLSQQIQAFYRNHLGHRLSEVVCQIFDHKIMIVLENSITQPEQLLVDSGKEKLVEELHTSIERTIEPQLSKLIEEVVGVAVVDLLSDATLKTKRTGMIAILSGEPLMRDRAASPAT